MSQANELLDRPLLSPDSSEIAELFRSRETQEACRFLLERRVDPPRWPNGWSGRGRFSVRGMSTASAGCGRCGITSPSPRIAARATASGSPPDRRMEPRRRLQTTGANFSARLGGRCLHQAWPVLRDVRRRPEEAELQIDHIVPRSWGGKTELDNLEPLCEKHNNGKKAFFKSLSPYSDALACALDGANPWERIGELLKAFAERGEHTPAELLTVVARETHKGDPKKRLRELRFVLGWEIEAHRVKENGVTQVTYELCSWQPWPPEGAQEAVNRYERERKRRKAAERTEDED